MQIEELIREALEEGFTYAVEIRRDSVELLEEVRQMCEKNTCRIYGKNWACPPACGTLEECARRLQEYPAGILLQTVGEIEDWMDFEGMMEVEKHHKETFERYVDRLRQQKAEVLPIGTGGCRICQECTYPHQPCRFPQRCFTSMEAYGMEVNRICKKNGLAYNYGPGKIAYTACCFLK